jgi:ATP/maltotriose-dependent transcriptional regulator MalT
MPFEAKVLIPSPCALGAVNGAFEDVANGMTTLLDAPSGYVLTEDLASAFTRLNRHPLWLRVGLEDRDPATFLLSVVTSARRIHHDAGQATGDASGRTCHAGLRHPAPVGGLAA